MDDKHYVPVLIGTSRKKNFSSKVAKFVCHEVQRFGFESDCIHPKDHLEFPVTARAGQEIKKRTTWHTTMNRAAALVIVTPEYNHGYPGELKLMIDMLYEEYEGKPVIVFGVSDSRMGGARVVENLLPVLAAIKMCYIRTDVYFSRVDKLLSDRGSVKSEKYKQRVEAALKKMDAFL